MNFKILFFLFLITLPNAHSATKYTIGALAGGQYVQADGDKAHTGAALRAYSSLLWGTSGVLIGPAIMIEFLGETDEDIFLGGALRIGSNTFLDVGVGALIGGRETSVGIFGILGTKLTSKWFLAFSMNYAESANNSLSYGPLFGVTF